MYWRSLHCIRLISVCTLSHSFVQRKTGLWVKLQCWTAYLKHWDYNRQGAESNRGGILWRIPRVQWAHIQWCLVSVCLLWKWNYHREQVSIMIVHGEGERESWLMHAYDLHFNIIIVIACILHTVSCVLVYTVESLYSGHPWGNNILAVI